MGRKCYGIPLSKPIARKLKEYVKKNGERKAASDIGVNFATLLRALAGLTVQAGTLALIERALDGQTTETSA